MSDGGNPVAMPNDPSVLLFFPSQQRSLTEHQDGIHQESDETGDHHIGDDTLRL